MNNRLKETRTKFLTWFKKLDNWTKLAGAIFALTTVFTIWMLITIVGLNMLPMKFLIPIILVVVLFVVGAFFAFFWPKLPAKGGKKKKKPDQKKVLITRFVGLILALCIVLIDAVGIRMLGQLQGAIGDMTGVDDDTVYEIVGVYVRADDHAAELSDVAAYDLALNYTYDKESIETAVKMMNEAFKKEMTFEEYDDSLVMVEALLTGTEDALLMNASYVTVLESMEGYEDISLRIKCIHEFKMVDKDAQQIEISEKPEDITKEPFIVYVSGNDTKSSMKKVRSDVNILAVVNPTTKQVLLINTPRDYYVEIASVKEGAYDKLTHCGIYGIECSMATLSDLYDHPVPYYAQVSFNGFVRLIDAMGGIEVYSDQSFFSAHSQTDIVKGYNFLNGEEALSFVRERHNLPDGDAARGRHQMAVIQAIIKKAASGAILTHYGDILDSMGGCFGTNLSNDEASDLVKMQLNDMASWNIKSFSVLGDGYGEKNYTYSIPNQKVYVLPQNQDYINHAKTLIDKVFDGETITDEDLALPTAE